MVSGPGGPKLDLRALTSLLEDQLTQLVNQMSSPLSAAAKAGIFSCQHEVEIFIIDPT